MVYETVSPERNSDGLQMENFMRKRIWKYMQ